MKKSDRNVPYPIYPPYQGMMPNQGMMMPNQGMMPYMPGVTPMMPTMPTSTGGCSGNTDMSKIEEEIDSLKRRVSYLENALQANSVQNGYNTTNYQVM